MHCSTLWFGVVVCGMVAWSVVWYGKGVMWYDVTLCGAVLCGLV